MSIRINIVALACNGCGYAVVLMPHSRCCVSGADFKHKTFDSHGHFFFSFLSVGKNNLKIYLQKFADIKYLRIFVE